MIKCDNRHGLFGGWSAVTRCIQEAEWFIRFDQAEVQIKPMNVCDNCLHYVKELQKARFELYNRPTKITIERIN
jgi:hypothetical protein